MQILLERAGHFFDSARSQASQDTNTDAPIDVSQDFSSPLLGPDQEAAVGVQEADAAEHYCTVNFVLHRELSSLNYCQRRNLHIKVHDAQASLG